MVDSTVNSISGWRRPIQKTPSSELILADSSATLDVLVRTSGIPTLPLQKTELRPRGGCTPSLPKRNGRSYIYC